MFVNSIDLHNNLKKYESPGLGKDKPASVCAVAPPPPPPSPHD